MIFFQWFRFFVVVSKCVPLRDMTCHYVPDEDAFSRDGADPWERAMPFLVGHVMAPLHVLSFLQHSCVDAIQCIF